MHRYEGGLREAYQEYSKEKESCVDINLFLAITKEFNQQLIEEVQTKGKVTLPERMGTISIVGTKPKVVIEDGKIKGLAPDWKATKELWAEDEEAKLSKQLVYHFNENTNGVRYRYLWSTKNIALINRTMYNLILTKGNKRSLSQLIQNGKEYLIIK